MRDNRLTKLDYLPDLICGYISWIWYQLLSMLNTKRRISNNELNHINFYIKDVGVCNLSVGWYENYVTIRLYVICPYNRRSSYNIDLTGDINVGPGKCTIRTGTHKLYKNTIMPKVIKILGRYLILLDKDGEQLITNKAGHSYNTYRIKWRSSW